MSFQYLEPATVPEAIALLHKLGPVAKVLAGGTDLVARMKEGTIQSDYVVDITGIPGLNQIIVNKDGLRIGALATIRALELSSELRLKYPMIAQAASQLGSVAIRNVATIGGNLCNATPSADMPPPLIGLSAEAKLIGPGGTRVVPLEDFFTGPYTTSLSSGELLVEVQIPPLPDRTAGVYLKHHMKGGSGLGSVAVGVVLTFGPSCKLCTDAKVVLGAVAPTPMRAHKAEAMLKGERITRKLIEEAAKMASQEARPRDSFRGSAEYKRQLVRVLAVDVIGRAAELARRQEQAEESIS